MSCTGEDRTSVDWWLALKAPGIDQSGNTKYAYLDNFSEVRNGSYVWREGTQIDGASDNPPADTLLPLYDPANQDVGSVMWSDEPGVTHCPQGCSSPVLGHSKGVLGLAAEGGFWLSHSVPKFPDSPADSNFTGIRMGQTWHGQSFACVSLTVQGLETLATLLQIATLDIYTPHTLPLPIQATYPEVLRLATDALGPYGPVDKMTKNGSGVISSRGGEQVTVFAKSSTGYGGQDVRMWEDLVEPSLHSAMFVQTWPEGTAQDLPSYCGPPDSPFPSLTVLRVEIPSARLSWMTRALGFYHDHSKWAVTAPPIHKVAAFCEGDNNRALAQEHRGGTAMCFTDNLALHAAVAGIVAGVASCSIPSPAPLPPS